jgi:hypothetical protein
MISRLRLLALLGPGLALAASPALADWRMLDDAEIAGALTGRRVVYEDVGWQMFTAAGRTLFHAGEARMGQTSLGEWQVRDGRSCQRWTTIADWTCYTVEYDGADGVRFTDALGNVSAGRFEAE